MNPIHDSTKTQQLTYGYLCGGLRGLSTYTLLYPLEVIKNRQQSTPSSEKSFKLAQKVFQQEGMGAFYQGLRAGIWKATRKQAWVGLMIGGTPMVLNHLSIDNISQQALTGLTIATLDPILFGSLKKIGWRGFTSQWLPLSIQWPTFLVAQDLLRNRVRQQQTENLNLAQLSSIGVQVALIVSLATAPLDMAINPTQHFSKPIFYNIYRRCPMNAFSFAIHNIASVIVIDKLNNPSG